AASSVSQAISLATDCFHFSQSQINLTSCIRSAPAFNLGKLDGESRSTLCRNRGRGLRRTFHYSKPMLVPMLVVSLSLLASLRMYTLFANRVPGQIKSKCIAWGILA